MGVPVALNCSTGKGSVEGADALKDLKFGAQISSLLSTALIAQQVCPSESLPRPGLRPWRHLIELSCSEAWAAKMTLPRSTLSVSVIALSPRVYSVTDGGLGVELFAAGVRFLRIAI